MSHLSNIIAAIPESDYPRPLRDALAFKAATTALVATTADEKPVSLSTAITPKDVAKVHLAAVAFDLGHDLRIQHANTLARLAVERLEAAQQTAASGAEARFVIEFDAAAGRLYEVLAKLGGVDPEAVDAGGWSFDPQYAELREVLADVARLGNLRDDYVFRSGGGQITFTPVSSVYERHSRTAILADSNAAAYIERRTASFGGRGAGARYWLTCVAAPGVRLCWQTSAAQASQPAPAAIAKSRADMADQVAAREAAFAARVSA